MLKARLENQTLERSNQVIRKLATTALAFVITFAAATSLPEGVASALDVVQPCPSHSEDTLTFSTKRTLCTNLVLDCDDLATHASLEEANRFVQ
jgi:hypothetical protein